MKYVLLGLILLGLILYINNKYKIYEGHNISDDHTHGIPINTYINNNISTDDNIQNWTNTLLLAKIPVCSEGENNENCFKLCNLKNNSNNILKSNCDDLQYCSSPISYSLGNINKSEMMNENVGICKDFDTRYIKVCPKDDYSYKTDPQSDIYREDTSHNTSHTSITGIQWANEGSTIYCIDAETENNIYSNICGETRTDTGLLSGFNGRGIPRSLCSTDNIPTEVGINNHCFNHIQISNSPNREFNNRIRTGVDSRYENGGLCIYCNYNGDDENQCR